MKRRWLYILTALSAVGVLGLVLCTLPTVAALGKHNVVADPLIATQRCVKLGALRRLCEVTLDTGVKCYIATDSKGIALDCGGK